MATIKEIKEQYPQYKDIPDAQLGKALYDKHYKDKMGYEEFQVRSGLDPSFDPNSTGTAVNQLKNNAITFGFGDEIAGFTGWSGSAVGDAAKQASNAVLGTDYKTKGIAKAASEGYDRMRDLERAKTKVARENLGYAAIPTEIVFGLGTGGPAKSALKQVPSLLNTAKTGAGWGALTGFGNSEGGFENRAKGAVQGGTIGAGTALGLNLATKALGPTLSFLGGAKDQVKSVVKPGTVADQKVLQSLDRAKLTPEQAAQKLDEFGDKPASLADIDPVMARLGRTAKVVSPEAEKMAQQAFLPRSRDQVSRVLGDLRSGLKVDGKTFKGEFDRIVSEKQSIAKPLYDRAFKEAQDTDTMPIIQRIQREISESVDGGGPLKKVLGFVTKKKKMVGPDGKPVTVVMPRTSLNELHKAKLAIDDMISKVPTNATSLGNNAKRSLTMFKNELVDAMEQNNPLYRSAREAFSDQSSLQNALANGEKFLSGKAEFMADDLAKLTKAEKDMFAVGVARKVKAMIGNGRIGNDVTGKLDTHNVRDALREVFPSEKAFKKFYEDVAQEATLTATKNKVLGGSETTDKAADLADFGFFRKMISAVKDPRSILDSVADWGAKNLTMSQKDANAMASIIFETNRKAQRETLQRLSIKYGKSKVRKMREFLGKEIGGAFASTYRAAGAEGAETQSYDALPDLNQTAQPPN